MYNILIRFHLLFFASSFFYLPIEAQEKTLVIMQDTEKYREVVINDSNHQMVLISSLIPAVIINLKYAEKNNFTGKRLYPPHTSETYLRLPAAKALKEICRELNKRGLTIKIFDAYRPYDITVQMWNLIKDERYVADPSKGSGHNRGLAVDLTLADMRTGKNLPMGTEFDNFTDSAHYSFRNYSSYIQNNRDLLRMLMEKYGFNALETEWWHFSWPNDRNYTVLNFSFRQLKRMNIPN
jgi:D-alanyl-D-alanine dipeptidase